MDVAIINQVTGVVVTVVDAPEANNYHPGAGLIAIDATGAAAYAGCLWSEAGGFQEPAKSLTKVALIAYAANARWQKEVGGVAWPDGESTHVIATDRESQGKLLMEFVAINNGLRADPSPWKFAGGYFVSLTNAQMSAVALVGRSFVADAYSREAAVQAGINAGTITTTAEIDAVFTA